jgi:hypothetical protein
MSRLLHVLAVAAATVITTEAVFRLSHFGYGVRSVFSEPFDLVNFTVKMVWWFGAWFFYWWGFRWLGRRWTELRRGRGTS